MIKSVKHVMTSFISYCLESFHDSWFSFTTMKRGGISMYMYLVSSKVVITVVENIESLLDGELE